MRLSKFQLEQILNQNEGKNVSDHLALDITSKDVITEENMMTKVKHYVDPTMLSSKDLLYKIAEKIHQLDLDLAKYHKERFDSKAVSEEFNELIDNGLEFRSHLRSFDWREATEFETLESIDTLSHFSHRQIIDELERLIDHPLYYKELPFLLKFSLASDDQDAKNSDRPDLEEFVRTEIFDNYLLADGRLLENVKIHFGEGEHNVTDATVAEVKLIEIAKPKVSDEKKNEDQAHDILDNLIVINGHSFTHFFPHLMDRLQALTPLSLLNQLENYHIEVKCYGGNMNDQNMFGFHFGRGPEIHRSREANAIKNAIARILYVNGSEEERKVLKNASILEYDDREKERTHLGRGFDKARKNRQWRRR